MALRVCTLHASGPSQEPAVPRAYEPGHSKWFDTLQMLSTLLRVLASTRIVGISSVILAASALTRRLYWHFVAKQARGEIRDGKNVKLLCRESSSQGHLGSLSDTRIRHQVTQ